MRGVAGSSGLATIDKASEAVNSVKVLNSLNKMADLLRVRVAERAAAGGMPALGGGAARGALGSPGARRRFDSCQL